MQLIVGILRNGEKKTYCMIHTFFGSISLRLHDDSWNMSPCSEIQDSRRIFHAHLNTELKRIKNLTELRLELDGL